MTNTIDTTYKKIGIITGIVTIVAATLTAIGVCNGFYFRTNIIDEAQSKSIIEIKGQISDMHTSINSYFMETGLTKGHVMDQDARMTRIEQALDRIESKIDGIKK